MVRRGRKRQNHQPRTQAGGRTKSGGTSQIHLLVGDGRCSWVTLDWVPKWKPRSAPPRPKGEDGQGAPKRARTSTGAVFLSYISQDAESPQHICAALRSAGAEVWFDQSELRGMWDQILQQIRGCALFSGQP
jgi:hypothetical protein